MAIPLTLNKSPLLTIKGVSIKVRGYKVFKDAENSEVYTDRGKR